jgi:hypothetical protein
MPWTDWPEGVEDDVTGYPYEVVDDDELVANERARD